LFVHDRLVSGDLGGSAAGVKAGTATSLTDFGGMDALVNAAKAEGSINVVALPDDWANPVARAFRSSRPWL